jgi:TRAP-type C4-dicarboxylate transport system substrate-binding protein
LKYADQNSATGWAGEHATQPWLNQLQIATGGRVQIEAYYSESLTKGVNAWNATRQDLADIAWMFHGYWAEQTPLANVISLPLLPFSSAKQASGIFWQLYQQYPSLRSEFQDNHVLLTWTSMPYFLVTTQQPVKTLEEIKGLKFRVPAGPPFEIMKTLGAVPVTVGMPDIYLYLEKGVIDGMATSWESLLSFRQYELVQYYTYIPLFTVYFTQAMNNETWDKLPPEIQKQINSVCGLEGSLFWGENMFDKAASIRTDFKKQSGIKMIEYFIPDDELTRWQAATQPIRDAWVKNMIEAGHPEAQDILNTTLELIRTYHP